MNYLDKLVSFQNSEENITKALKFFSDPRVVEITTIEELCELTGVDTALFPFPPSEYQLNFFKAVALPYVYDDLEKFDIALIAVAGAGKSYCIVKSMLFVPATETKLCMAFNQSTDKNMKKNIVKHRLQHAQSRTVHSIGFQALRENLRKHYERVGSFDETSLKYLCTMTIDRFKSNKFIKKYLEEVDYPTLFLQNPDFDAKKYKKNIRRLVNLGRNTCSTSEGALTVLMSSQGMLLQANEPELASKIIKAMVYNTNTIDQTDMIWLPHVFQAICDAKGIAGWQFETSNVSYLDECQDLSNLQRSIYSKTCKPSTRRIMVGDEKQLINAFAGASVQSFRDLTKDAVVLPLTESFRCPQFVVDLVSEHVPYFEVNKNNPEGIYEAPDDKVKTSWVDVEDGAYILGRNTAPLVSACMYYLKQGRKASIMGLNLANGIVSFLKAYTYPNSTIEAVIRRMGKDIEKQAKEIARELGVSEEDIYDHDYIGQMVNKMECIKAFAEESKTIADIERKINETFSDKNSDGITLMTAHKSKGLESKYVYILDYKMFSPTNRRVRTDQDATQAKNLLYVVRTRTSYKLGHLSLQDIKPKKEAQVFTEKQISDAIKIAQKEMTLDDIL